MEMARILLKDKSKLDRTKVAFLILTAAVTCVFSSSMVNFPFSDIVKNITLTGTSIDPYINAVLVIFIAPFYIFLFSDQAIFTIPTAIFGFLLAYLIFQAYFEKRKQDIQVLIARGVSKRTCYGVLTIPVTFVSFLGIIVGYIAGAFISALFWIYYSSVDNPDFVLFHSAGSESEVLYYHFPYITYNFLWPLLLILLSIRYVISLLLLVTCILVLASLLAFINTEKDRNGEDFNDPENYSHTYSVVESSLKLKLFIFFISAFVIVGMIFSNVGAREIPFLLVLSIGAYLLFAFVTVFLMGDILEAFPFYFKKAASSRLILAIIFSSPLIAVLGVLQLYTGFTIGMTFLWVPIDLVIYAVVFLLVIIAVFIVDMRIEFIYGLTVKADRISKEIARYIASLPFNVMLVLILSLSMTLTSALSYHAALEENIEGALFTAGSDIRWELSNQRLYDTVPMEHVDRIIAHPGVVHATRVFKHNYYYLGVIQGIQTTELIFINVSDFRNVVSLKDEFFIGGTVNELFQKMKNDESSVLIDLIKAREMGLEIGDSVQFIANDGSSFAATVIGFIKKFPLGYDTDDTEFMARVHSFAVLNIAYANYYIASGGYTNVAGFSRDENWRPTSSYLIKTRKAVDRTAVVQDIQGGEGYYYDLGLFAGGSRTVTVDDIISDMDASKECINFQILGTSAVSSFLAGLLTFCIFLLADQRVEERLTTKRSAKKLLPAILISLTFSWFISSILLVFLDFQFLPGTVLGKEMARILRTIASGLIPSLVVTFIVFITGIYSTTIARRGDETQSSDVESGEEEEGISEKHSLSPRSSS